MKEVGCGSGFQRIAGHLEWLQVIKYTQQQQQTQQQRHQDEHKVQYIDVSSSGTVDCTKCLPKMLVSCLVAARFLAELQPHFWHMSPCHICNYRTRALQLHWKHFSQNWIYLSSERGVLGPRDGHTARPLIILNACHQIDRWQWLPQSTMWAHFEEQPKAATVSWKCLINYYCTKE